MLLEQKEVQMEHGHIMAEVLVVIIMVIMGAQAVAQLILAQEMKLLHSMAIQLGYILSLVVAAVEVAMIQQTQSVMVELAEVILVQAAVDIRMDMVVPKAVVEVIKPIILTIMVNLDKVQLVNFKMVLVVAAFMVVVVQILQMPQVAAGAQVTSVV